MPKSKHRVKKNGKRPVKKNKEMLSAIFLPKSDIDKVKSLFTQVELIAETKLQKGTCNFDDVAMIRDVFNMAAWSITYWGHMTKAVTLSEEWVEANADTFLKAQDAFHEFYQRGNELGGVDDPTVRYVCRGDELTAIKDGVLIAGDLCQQMLDDSPIQFIRLFDAMKRFLKGKGQGKLEFDGDKLAEQMKRY